MKPELVKDAAIKRGCLRRNIKIFASVITGVYFVLGILYFVTPISTVNEVTIKGQHYYETSLINTALNEKLPSGKAYLPTFDDTKYENLLISSKANNTYSLLTDIKVKSTMFKLEVDFKDVIPVFQYGNSGEYNAYLGNGDRVPSTLPTTICDIPIATYLTNLPIFVEKDYVLDKNEDFNTFALSHPLSINKLSYVKKNSRNTYHLYVKDSDLTKKLNNDNVYIRFTVADDKVDDFLNNREINNAIRVINNTSINNITTSNDDSLNGILGSEILVVVNDRTTNGE